MSQAQTIVQHVNTPSRSYDVHVGAGVLDAVGKITREAAGGKKCCVISETHVAPHYLDRVRASLEAVGYEVHDLVFEAGERSKNIHTLETLLEGLAAAELTRDDVVVALGGGVAGDIGGLAAAMYLRDCKNLAGFFWQPSAVIADVECFRTLSPELFTDSVGEVVKHAVLASPELLDELSIHPMNAGGYPEEKLARIVAQNVGIKRDVVDADERESGVRQTLNLGHTIGHGIEAASNFALGHGSCVAAGPCCMARAAAELGWCTPRTRDRIVGCVEAHGLPTDTNVDHDVLFGYMTHDKKRHGDTMNIVVPDEIGNCTVKNVSFDELRRIVELGCGKRA